MLLLPPGASTVYTFQHPCTGTLAQFVVQDKRLFELRAVRTRRSRLLQARLSRDPLRVAVYMNPLYLVLPLLFEHRARALPLSFVLELLAQSGDTVPATLVRDACVAVCTSTESDDELLLQLDTQLLDAFLAAQTARVETCCPPSALAAVYTALGHSNIVPPPPETAQRARTYCAVSLIANSYLNPALRAHFLAQHDFSDLERTVRRQALREQSLQAPQAAVSPRPASAPKRPRKEPRKAPAAQNNRSILDMFARR